MVAPDAAPTSSLSASAVARSAPVALFQLGFATTPALSATPIVSPASLTKLTLITRPARTINCTVVLCVSVPLVPVMVSVDVPAGVVAPVVTVNVLVPDPAIEDGANEAVAFAGTPVTDRATVLVNPLTAPGSPRS